jgi:hypothetical protein
MEQLRTRVEGGRGEYRTSNGLTEPTDHRAVVQEIRLRGAVTTAPTRAAAEAAAAAAAGAVAAEDAAGEQEDGEEGEGDGEEDV